MYYSTAILHVSWCAVYILYILLVCKPRTTPFSTPVSPSYFPSLESWIVEPAEPVAMTLKAQRVPSKLWFQYSAYITFYYVPIFALGYWLLVIICLKHQSIPSWSFEPRRCCDGPCVPGAELSYHLFIIHPNTSGWWFKDLMFEPLRYQNIKRGHLGLISLIWHL
jgi:hypothetical protein